MTESTAALLDVAPPGSAGAAWRGRLAEFLLVGGATLVLHPFAWLCRRAFGLDAAELAFGFVTFHAAAVINDPHFAVTYVLFYRDARRRLLGDAFPPAQRLRYLAAGVLVPLALAGWAGFAIATRSAAAMGWMIQLMFLLVGWHYVKQGFGVLTVLSARRGVRFSPFERAAFLAHCFAGWAYAKATPAGPGILAEEKGVVFMTLARPAAIELGARIAFFLSAIVLAGALARKGWVERRLPPLAPLCGLLVSVWLWTVYAGIDPLMRYVIPALHSVQYHYFVWLLTRNEARSREGPPSFGPPARVRIGALAVTAIGLGWLLLHGAPSFLDAAFASPRARRVVEAEGGLGPTPFLAALYVLVNLHHYFMDSVIWRRENPETRHLLDGVRA